jgi:hypothetical protein
LLGQKHAAAHIALAVRWSRRGKSARNRALHCKKFRQVDQAKSDQIDQVSDMSSGGATLSGSGLT